MQIITVVDTERNHVTSVVQVDEKLPNVSYLIIDRLYLPLVYSNVVSEHENGKVPTGSTFKHVGPLQLLYLGI